MWQASPAQVVGARRSRTVRDQWQLRRSVMLRCAPWMPECLSILVRDYSAWASTDLVPGDYVDAADVRQHMLRAVVLARLPTRVTVRFVGWKETADLALGEVYPDMTLSGAWFEWPIHARVWMKEDGCPNRRADIIARALFRVRLRFLDTHELRWVGIDTPVSLRLDTPEAARSRYYRRSTSSSCG